MRLMRSLTSLALVLLLGAGLAACGDDDDGEEDAVAEETSSEGSALSIEGFAFAPDALTVSAGTTVTVTNEDGAPHTWTSDDDAWDSGNLEQGATFEHTFDEAGEFAYHCNIHPNMTGTITVE